MTADITWKTAADLSRLYGRKELSPVEAVEHFLKRAEMLQPHLNSLVLMDASALLLNAFRKACSRLEYQRTVAADSPPA